MYVSSLAGQEQARTFLHLDVGGAAEADLEGGTIVLAEAQDGTMADQAALSACALTGPLSAGGELQGDTPGADCSTHASLERAADGSWSLLLGPFARGLASGASQGLVILPGSAASPPATFTVAFDSGRTRLDLPVGQAPSSSAVPGVQAGAEGAPAALVHGPGTVGAAGASGTAGPYPGPGQLQSRSQSQGAQGAQAAQPPAAPGPVAAPPAGSAPAAVESVLPLRARRAASPPALVLLPVVLVPAGLGLVALRRSPALVGASRVTVPVALLTRAAAGAALIALALAAGEATAYKLGLIAIVFVGAIGLHILVNWSGELSLAHAGFIGLPAFAVAQLSLHAHVSPILVLPLGVVAGASLGLVVALAALRARGLQVALVTLAVGIAISRFFFVRSWVIGPPAGLHIAAPSLFGLPLETSRSLLPVLLVVVAVAALASRSLLESKVGRALSLVRSNPDAAAAVGIPVALYRGAVYGMAGAFAGLAGASYVLWVQRLSPKAFPLDLGFTYLVIAVLAGKGPLTGVALAAVLIEGGQVFKILPQDFALYAGPVALIFNVTKYQEGFNGLLRETRQRLGRRKVALMGAEGRTSDVMRRWRGLGIRLPVVIATLLVVAGFTSVGLAWYHAGNTDQVWIQNQEIVSGGIGGLGLIVLGAVLLLRDALLHGRGLVERSSRGAEGAEGGQDMT
ncbi:MAG TPA: branched-chain amino acid ABC transporter permease, partial [Acidimicrobiales bacterium]|nr:branched-chain amino acid ABC transporter permease [Acidimicrobiales bacterium]